ncbi:MAG: GNAT family N-acetyltransferase [Candidatus Sulfobium sp.]
MTKKKDFTIRTYCPGDEIGINEMFNEVFGQQRPIEHWYWKYRNNLFGSCYVSLAVSSEGRMAAHYAGYPVRLVYYETGSSIPEESPVCQLGDKMTRQEFRSVGFGKSSLLARTFAHFRQTYRDLAFSYGFLTHHSLRFGILFFNYCIIEPVPYRKLAWRDFRISSATLLRRRLKGLTVEAITEVDGAWDRFFEESAPRYRYLVKRDTSYFRWRYLERPDRRYLVFAVKRRGKLAGWAVFHQDGNRIVWGDALFNTADADCVAAVLSHLREVTAGTDYIECWFPPRPAWWDSILRQLGFQLEEEPHDFRFCIVNFAEKEIPYRLKSLSYYTIGDSDLF